MRTLLSRLRVVVGHQACVKTCARRESEVSDTFQKRVTVQIKLSVFLNEILQLHEIGNYGQKRVHSKLNTARESGDLGSVTSQPPPSHTVVPVSDCRNASQRRLGQRTELTQHLAPQPRNLKRT